MKKSCLKKIVTVTLLCTAITTSVIPAYALSMPNSICELTTQAEPRTDIKGWVYKVINGDLYKRLYNYTRNRYEGDWIFVASGV